MKELEMMTYSAIHFLHQWLTIESKFYQAFQSNNSEIRRKKAIEIATYFSVVRSLETKYDVGVGLKRFEPVMNLLNKYEKIEIKNNQDAIKLINDFIDELEFIYKKRLISFSSKILWMNKRFPIIIYDNEVRKGIYKLDYPSGKDNISQYYNSWYSLYDKYKEQVFDSCNNLKNLNLEVKNLNEIIDSDWFQSRVFDIYLLFKGSGALTRQELLNYLK